MPFHVPVTAHKFGLEEHDVTQRSRSYLYAALWAAVAHVFGLGEVWFYENGVTSVNLPPCAQEVGGRATRTTHPQVLHGFQRGLSLVFGRPFKVGNGFLWHTKQDVVALLARHRQPDLTRTSVSCSHTRWTGNVAGHCGMCSQCLSRRVATLGAAVGADDPPGGYRADPLTDPRKKDEQRTLAERFVGQARAVARMTAVRQFDRKYAGELARVYPYLNLPTAVAAEKLFDLHLRHVRQAADAVAGQIAVHASDLYLGRLADSCALAYAVGGGRAPAGPAVPPATDPGDGPEGGGDGGDSGDDRGNSAGAGGVAPARDDGYYPPDLIVWRGREHRCDLTRNEGKFLTKAIRQAQTDVHLLMNVSHDAVWKGRYTATEAKRDTISQAASRLSRKLRRAVPPVPLFFSLRRGQDYVSREATGAT